MLVCHPNVSCWNAVCKFWRSEGRQKVCPTLSWGWGREQNEGLGYRSTPSLMFMSNPSQIQRGAGWPKSITNQTCSSGETEQVTNQTRSIAGTEGQCVLQIKAAPSVGWRVKQITVTPSRLPLVRVWEGKKSKVGPSLSLTLKRQNERSNDWQRESAVVWLLTLTERKSSCLLVCSSLSVHRHTWLYLLALLQTCLSFSVYGLMSVCAPPCVRLTVIVFQLGGSHAELAHNCLEILNPTSCRLPKESICWFLHVDEILPPASLSRSPFTFPSSLSVCVFESVFTCEILSMYPPPCLTCCRDSTVLLTPSSMLVCASPALTEMLNHFYMETGIVNKNQIFPETKKY